MIKRFTSLLRRIVGRFNEAMVTSLFMTIGTIAIPSAFFLVVAGYEFNKPAVWGLAFILFGFGIFALWYSFKRAFEEEDKTRKEKRELDKNSADRHNEMKQLLQSINNRLIEVGKQIEKLKR